MQISTGGKRLRIQYGTKLLLLLIPFIILTLVFSYVPLFGWILAFTNYKLGMPFNTIHFTGFENFKIVYDFYMDDVVRVLTNTLILNFMGLLFTVLPVAFAIMLSEIKIPWFKKITQTVSTFPNFISYVIVFSLAFSTFSLQGLINDFLLHANLIKQPIDFLGNPDIAWFFQAGVSLWKTLGWGAVIYLAAITGIDLELYDASKVDGAGRMRRILHITIPGISETYFVLLLLAISNMLSSSFDQYMMFMNPLVQDKIEVIDYFVYRVGIIQSDVPISVVMGMAKTFISIALLFSANSIAKKYRGTAIV